ncbi:unnamed protein product [Blepharisma stoltei]|uniref:Uncharacterized protein n=1 Tax=Blepharisma stoltei TaxID=1481888 RepID=A0AAU9JK41_9CILI|nr:unnamed protein product [Blepharisma stoltei]
MESKRVSWKQSKDLSSQYNELASKFDNAIKPLTLEEINSKNRFPQMVWERMDSADNIKKSSEHLRRELELISSKKERDFQSQKGPSESMWKKHEKLLEELESDSELLPKPKNSMQKSSKLSFLDVISNHEVKEFMKKYYKESDEITTKEFIDCLEFEYPLLMDTEGIKEELAQILSIGGQKTISLNALEIFTRDQGLENSIAALKTQIIENIQDSKKQINAQIVDELMDIKDALDIKSQELDQREEEVSFKEKEILDREENLMSDIQERVLTYANQAREKIKSEINVQLKRLKSLEETVSDKLKLLKSKLEPKKTGTDFSKSQDANANKYKARIQSLEKSNEHLKNKLNTIEAESKNDKNAILKLQEEISRLKSRNSMLEQSVMQKSKIIEPEKVVTPTPITVEKESTKLISMTPELSISINTIYTLLNCSRLTVSYIAAPSSPRSVASHRTSIITDDVQGNIGEIYYPSFNTLAPQLIELLPFIDKLKNCQAQFTMLWGLWELLIFAQNNHTDNVERRYCPNNLEFIPSTEVWKKKLAQGKPKSSRRPLYQLFSSNSIHKAIGYYLSKLIEKKGKNQRSKEIIQLSLISSLLALLLSISKKRIEIALLNIKNLITDPDNQDTVVDILLVDIKGSIQTILHFLELSDELSCHAIDILLSLTIDQSYFSYFIQQCQNQQVIITISEACRKVVARGLRSGKAEEFEESLLILLQRLTSQESLRSLFREQGICEILLQRSRNCEDQGFFTSNLNSIIRNLT